MYHSIIKLFNLEEKHIQSFHAVNKDNTFHAYITLNRNTISCSRCGSISLTVKDYRDKHINHAIFNNRQCLIHYHARRFHCKDCGLNFYEDNPFINPFNPKNTTATVTQILTDLKRLNYTFTSVALKNNTSISTAVKIFDQYVSMPRLSLPEILSIDEVYKGSKHKDKYACVFFDFSNSKIVDILNSRKKNFLYSYMQPISKQERQNVKYVVTDMYKTYIRFAYHFFPHCTVIIDSFHVIQGIIKALDKIRLRIMSQYKNDSIEYYLLKNFNYLLLMNRNDIPYNKPLYNKKLGYYINKTQLHELISKINPELKRAYQLKEDYIYFNATFNYDNAVKEYDNYIDDFIQSQIEEYKEVIGYLRTWKKEILNSFIRVNGRRISNGPIETVNGKIKVIINNALGYKNFERLRNRIMYSLSKDSIIYNNKEKVSLKIASKPRGTYKK